MRHVLALCCFVFSAVAAFPAQAAPCDLSGTWAVQYTVPLTWRFNAGLQGGSGSYVLQARVIRTARGDGSYADAMQVCQRTMPTTKTLILYGSEQYGSVFSPAPFDAGALPVATTTLHLAGANSEPGGTFQADPAAFLLGLAMADPLHDAFPRRTTDAMVVATDPDGDGRLGLRMDARQDGGLSLPPVNPRRSKRAIFFDLTARDVVAASGTVQSCDELRGTGEIAAVAGKPGLQATVIGCGLDDGSDCVRSDLGIVNGFQPSFVPHPGEVVMYRLADAATCADVRALW